MENWIEHSWSDSKTCALTIILCRTRIKKKKEKEKKKHRCVPLRPHEWKKQPVSEPGEGRGPFGRGSECALTDVKEDRKEEAVPREGNSATKEWGRTVPFCSGP